MKSIVALLMFTCNVVHAQVNEMEQEYLTKLSESFVNDSVVNETDPILWSRCLGSDAILSKAELNKQILGLVNNDTLRIAFYKRLNHYLSSPTMWYHGTLNILQYAQDERMSKSERKKKLKENGLVPPPPPNALKLVFDRAQMETYIAHILSYGIDQELMKPCSLDTNEIYYLVDEVAQYPGGDTELIKFLANHIKYPDMERDNDIQGKVILRFVVCENGRISDIKIIKSVTPGLDKESVYVIKMFPPFLPAKKNGKVVKAYFTLPIVYKMQ